MIEKVKNTGQSVLQKTWDSTLGQVLPFPLGGNSELVAALKRDHQNLRELIGTLKDDKVELPVRRNAYKHFATLLKSHSLAEEKAVYSLSEDLRALKQETHEGFIEHEIAESLMGRISHIRRPDRWQAAVKVLAELVQHHIDEEEKEYFPKLEEAIPANQKFLAEAKFLELRKLSQRPGLDAGVVSDMN